MTAPDRVNGTTAPPAIDPVQRQRVRFLVRQIANRQPLFRNVLRAHFRDLDELIRLTGIHDIDVRVHLCTLERNITDLLYYASGGEHDRHAPPGTSEPPP